MSEFVLLGEITGHYGVKGWVKVKSFTRPATQILEFSTWYVPWAPSRDWLKSMQTEFVLHPESLQKLELTQGKRQQRGLIAKLIGIDCREQSQGIQGRPIVMEKSQLAPAGPGEFYWSELIGMRVVNLEQIALGVVDHLLETGANDVLVVRNKVSSASDVGDGSDTVERLIPWSDQVISDIDRSAGLITVDWDAGF